MERLAKLLKKSEIFSNTKGDISAGFPDQDGVHVYKNSVHRLKDRIYLVAALDGNKSLFLASEKGPSSDFQGESINGDGMTLQSCPLSWENYQALAALFPFTEPISLRRKRTTVGFGDRLGLATPGHIQAIESYNAYPVFAQQSIRELTLTSRTYHDVVSDAAFLVFQEGFKRGYGADGDHLKTLADIDVALEAGMPMITLDLTEVMNPEPAEWSEAKIVSSFEGLAPEIQRRVLDAYAGKSFSEGSYTISISELEAKKCALMYWKAIDFSETVNRRLAETRGDAYDLEISIDETTTPTLPEHHVFIIRELNNRGVSVNSLAPRFIGEFQKGIDYIGNVDDFEEQFKIHSEIAQANGNYKISIHSGSDKFSVYPAIGHHTNLRLHLKTAGTSWLEAVRTISLSRPELYRRMHKKAFQHFGEATKLYHITADLSKIVPLESIDDDKLEQYLNAIESRQLLHITYGGLLHDVEVRDDFFKALNEEENLHYEIVKKHLEKHLRLLGLDRWSEG